MLITNRERAVVSQRFHWPGEVLLAFIVLQIKVNRLGFPLPISKEKHPRNYIWPVANILCSKFKDRLASIYCRLMRSENSARCEPAAISSSQIWHLGKRPGCLMPWAVFQMKLAKISFLIEDRGRPAIIYMCLDNIHLPYIHISWFFLGYSFPSSYPFGSTSLE